MNTDQVVRKRRAEFGARLANAWSWDPRTEE